MLRILFVTTKIGFGHKRVSNILANAIRNSFPDCATKITTYFDFFPQSFHTLINTIYVSGLRLFPEVFGYIYLKQKRYKGTGVDFWSRFLGRKYADLIKKFSPGLIIITQGLACQWLGRLKKKGLVNVPLAAVITDYIAHPFWISPEIDLYIAATEDIKNDLISRGIPYYKIAPSGIPIDPRFASLYKKDEGKIKFKNALGLSAEKIAILVMGGGWGLGGIDKVLPIIDGMKMPLELLVVTGKNRSLYRKLKNKKYNLPVHIFGKVDNICELMAASDIVITKAGGVTVSELLASGLPAIIWDVIPGQEEANAEYLVKNGAAIKVDNVGNMKNEIRKLVLSPEIRNNMRARSQRLGKENSTTDAVSAISRFIVQPVRVHLNYDRIQKNKSIFNLLEYLGYKLYLLSSRILPLRFTYLLADFVGYIVFKLNSEENSKRAVIMRKIYKGQIDIKSADKLIRKNIQLFNRDLVDFFRSNKLDKDNIDSFIKIEGIEYLDNALKEGKGVLCVSVHMGNWEMGGIALAVRGYPVYGMFWEAKNKRLANMFKKIRLKKGIGTVEISSLRQVLELLHKNKIICIMLDINEGAKGIPYSTWGYDFKLPRGPASISLKTGAAPIIAVIVRNKDTGYTLHIEKPDLSGREEEITINMFEIIKKYIEQDPVQWHWIKYFFGQN